MAITENLWLLPGILGSELRLGPGVQSNRALGDALWVNPVRLGGTDQLDWLAMEAFQPTVDLVPGGPLAQGYQEMWTWMHRWAPANGRRPFALGYDWRRSVLDVGKEFATRIRNDTQGAVTSNCIVAHSMGGLVARAAWRELAISGESAKVRRIITLGTPHFGTYGVVRVFTGTDPTIQEANRLLLRGPWRLRDQTLRLVRIAASWPSMYELMPFRGKGDAGDPDRLKIFDLANYPADRGLSAAGLATVSKGMSDVMALADSKPPAEVLTMVAGDAHQTASRLVSLEDLGRSDRALGFTDAGDGQVPHWSARPDELPGRKYLVAVQHFHLPRSVLHHLAGWITEGGAVPGSPVQLPDKLQPARAPSREFATIDIGPKLPGLDTANPTFGAPHDC